MANLQSQIDILAKAVVKEHINLEDYKKNNKGSVSLTGISNEIDVYNTVGEAIEIDGGGVKVDYKDESYKLEVSVDGNPSTTTVFTYDNDHDFSGFLFYDTENKYAVNDNGEIVSSNSKNFYLESDTFVRRISLNEGEIGETQSEKNVKRMIYTGEIIKTNIDNIEFYYNLDTLRIIKSNNSEWVGNYYVEFDKSITETETETETETIQLIVDSSLKGITHPILDQNNPEYYVVIDDKVDVTTGINFNIKNGNDIVYAYRSRDIDDIEFVNMIDDVYFTGNGVLLGIHLAPGVETIGNRAFSTCYKLKEVIIPYSVKKIGFNAFISCSNLKTITIKGTPTTIGEHAFKTLGSILTIYCNETTKNTITQAIENTDYKDNITFASLE